MARQSLQNFLKYAKSSLRADIAAKRPITFVIGNESADLDSLTSSILLAYIKSEASLRGEPPQLSIPILNIPAADVQLRPEFRALFRHANINAGNLITLDDLPREQDLATNLSSARTRWILVDHNRLQGKLGELYSSRVIGAIDHHEDEHKVPTDTDKEPRIIETSGSCTSHVVQYCQDAWDTLSDPSEQALASDVAKWDSELAKLALGSILIDTTNLKAKEKTKEVDLQAVKYLEDKIQLYEQNAQAFDRTALFDELTAAKEDLDHLGLSDILRKDYKQWDENGMKLGISSVVKPLKYLAGKAAAEQKESEDKAGLLASFDIFSEERRLAVYAVMTTSKDEQGRFCRELLLRVVDGTCTAVMKKFVDSAHSQLQLEHAAELESVVTSGQKIETDTLEVWFQRNVAASRKQVAPLLREAMK